MNEYYYLDSQNQQQGPVFPTQFAMLGITSKTMVWCNGMTNWQQAGTIPELAAYIVPTPQPRPTPTETYGQAPYSGYGPNPNMIPPQSYLVWAILTTLFCCLPLGIVSIVYSSQVDSEWNRGNVENAYRKSRLAKNWAIASACSAVVCFIIYIIFIVCIGASGMYY